MLLHNPASAVLSINFHLAVLAANLLLCEKFVILVVYLDVGVAIGIVHESVHIVAANCIGDELNVVAFLHILANHNDVGDMVVIPIAIAIQPESGPIKGSGRERIPKEGMTMHHAVMMRMPEIRCWVHRTM